MAYSPVKSVYLGSQNISALNKFCRFERIELVENITDTLPVGTLVVTDLSDIVTTIEKENVKNVTINLLDGSSIEGHITSVSYINNATSDNDTTTVAINFTNKYYELVSSNSLNALLGYRQPVVFGVQDFVDLIRVQCFESSSGYSDFASNFFLYKPLTPYNSGEEAIPDNAVEMMQYLANGAIDNHGNPNFAFWTSFNGDVNFKSFKRNPGEDPSAEKPINIAVYDGDTPTRKIDGTSWRKAYFIATNPAYQWISKNYYYIRKTPKYLDELDNSVSGSTAQETATLKNLMFHFQDDGQKYNIDVVTVDGRGTNIPSGGDNIFTDNPWGYFPGQRPNNQKSNTTLIGNQYGIENNYKTLELMGTSGYMPFSDSPDMWKNMFDLTPIHPHYPDNTELPATSESLGISGLETHLQSVMNIRYDTFKETQERLETLRQIESQNFVLHSLCCMGKEECFFALLQRYEPDYLYYGGISGGNCGGSASTAPKLPAGATFYRYKWNKLRFDGYSPGSSGGNSGGSGGISGSSYDVAQIEKWSLDPVVKSGITQDHTWAINLNERGLSPGYLPPGWIKSTSPSCKFRPIGTSDTDFKASANIAHIARVCLYQADANNKVAYFCVENVVDCNC